MKFLYQLILFAILIPFASCADVIYKHCVQNFTNNNILQDSINKAIYDIVAKTPSNGFATSTTGGVYGLTRCRGDISVQACSDCIVAAAQNLRESCPNSADSRIWCDSCFLRYNTINFLGTADTSDALVWRPLKSAEEPKAFNTAVGQLLGSIKVAAESGTKKFGIGKRRLNADTTVYGMAQCTQDLPGFTCMQCLETMTSYMLSKCKDLTGCVVMSSSCLLRYEIYNFLLADAPVFPAGDAAAPAPSVPA